MTRCKLGRDPNNRNQKKCRPEECKKCGWDETEHLRRQMLLQSYGLTKGKDGLWRLEG